MPNSKISRTTPETQGNRLWTPPGGVLGKLIAKSAEREIRLLGAAQDAPTRSFRQALDAPELAVIAEVKRRSPSRGEINAALRPAEQAAMYEQGGAAAVSVLTEPESFSGSLEDLLGARGRTILPMLRKDFIVREEQLDESKAWGASAALLIVRALHPEVIRSLAAKARAIDLEILFEVRDEYELEQAIEAGAEMIGVNNRNLETLEVDHGLAERIVPCIPSRVIAIAESGYSTRADVERAAAAGADAVLVGSALSQAADPAAAVTRLTGVPKVRRGG